MLILESYRACSYCVLMAMAVLEGSGFAVLSEHRVTRTTCVSSTIAKQSSGKHLAPILHSYKETFRSSLC